MFNPPGKTMTMHDIPEIVGHTFPKPKAMTPTNIQAEFRVAWLVPVNRDVFEDCDFIPEKYERLFLSSEQYHTRKR